LTPNGSLPTKESSISHQTSGKYTMLNDFHDARIATPSEVEKEHKNGESEVDSVPLEATCKKNRYTILHFHSKAKPKSDEAFLSTYAICNLVIDGAIYPTVEHYFQSKKFKVPDQWRFKGSKAKFRTAKEANSAGKRGTMRRLFGYSPSMIKWKGPSDDNDEDYYNIRVMKKALWTRWTQDKRFQAILKVPGRLFELYEKRTCRGVTIQEWGRDTDKQTSVSMGLNILGNLYNELACFHDIDGFFECVVDGRTVFNWSGSTPHHGKLFYFPYPRNTFGPIRQDERYGREYVHCGYKVKDCDVVHPFIKASSIMTNPGIILHA
jgi:predicted NAD-dependent protein-ADP-ribosyltransferase YbiA (DUF1768 family)